MDYLEKVKLAYKHLKKDTYYNQLDLFLRKRIAAFEASTSFNRDLNKIAKVLKLIHYNKYKDALILISPWLKEIDFRVLPKKIKNRENDNEKGLYISNCRSLKKYEIDSVNYFITAPIPIYIFSVLWCHSVGVILDNKLSSTCFGNRLDLDNDNKISNKNLFKMFHYQYSKWRDEAVRNAENILDNDESTLIISLDIKQCYYHIKLNWNELLVNISPGDNYNIGLCKILKFIHYFYRKASRKYIMISHKIEHFRGLPVGLPSSSVIANYIIKKFDDKIFSNVIPNYYGRYVDDILIVLREPPKSILNDKIKSIFQYYFKDILIPISGDSYCLKDVAKLEIQQQKLIVHYFDKEHSKAGLHEFIEKIKRASSEFKFLPADEENQELDKCVYDILYEGSINKFRSIIEIRENATEFSKFLASRILEHRLTSNALNKNLVVQLIKFYKGINVFDFVRLWEKTLTLLLIKNSYSDMLELIRMFIVTINSLEGDKVLLKRLKRSLREYLQISLAMPISLFENSELLSNANSKDLVDFLEKKLAFNVIVKNAKNIRQTNLMRHNLVCYPLLNYTSYSGDLRNFNLKEIIEFLDKNGPESLTVKGKKEELSPRYIHEDENVILKYLNQLLNNQSDTINFCSINETLNDIPSSSVNTQTDTKILRYNIDNNLPDKLSIGVVNMHVCFEDIKASYHPLRVPITSYQKQASLFKIINLALEQKCDLLVLPEVSVPYSWLPFMINQSRTKQIGLVFGLEHMAIKNHVYNLIVSCLPYKKNKHNSCFVSIRSKNHYAPKEKFNLEAMKLKTVSPKPTMYEIFKWKGCVFTAFNCFELTDIQHRSLFRGNVDLMIAAEWNSDIPYFSNIIETTIRDNHCYLVQVNTSQYGDSRVSIPKETKNRNLIQVTGGKNTTLLKAELNIKALREFQIKNYDPTDNNFKPLPAGYDSKQVKERYL